MQTVLTSTGKSLINVAYGLILQEIICSQNATNSGEGAVHIHKVAS
jgi:hypothetical protein